MPRLAIVGGTGLDDPTWLGEARRSVRVETRYGSFELSFHQAPGGEEIVFLARHGRDHGVAPHLINYRAAIASLRKVGVERVIASSAVGSLHPDLAPGQFVVLDQFLDFTKSRPLTLFDEGAPVHADFTEPYCPEIRRALLDAAAALGEQVRPTGTYVGVEGPRYETSAEIRAFSQLGGDVVGMTGLPEAVLAREAGLCYASVAVVTNPGAGIEAAHRPSHAEVTAMMAERRGALLRLMLDALSRLPAQRRCACASHDVPVVD